jgi:hypothetical protein
VWQCVSGFIPFGTLDKEILPTSPGAQELRENLTKFKSGSTKGPLIKPSASGSDVMRCLYNLCRQCCNPESLLRPTSAAVAQRLQDLLITALDQIVSRSKNISIVDVNEIHADTPPNEAAQIRNLSFEAVLLREVQIARDKNSTGQSVQREPNPPISSEDFANYVNDELEYDQERLPTKDFLIGAALWWQLVPEYFVREVSSDEIPNPLVMSDKCRSSYPRDTVKSILTNSKTDARRRASSTSNMLRAQDTKRPIWRSPKHMRVCTIFIKMLMNTFKGRLE